METASGRSKSESSKDLPTSRRRLAIYLLAAARVLAGASDVPEAARRLLAMIGEAEGWCAGAVWLAEEGRERLRCAEVWCPPERPAPELERACRTGSVTRGLGLVGRVWSSGRAVIVTDVGRDEDVRRDPRVEREKFRAVAAVPIAAGTDVIGVLELFGSAPRDADPLLGEVLASVAGQLAEFVRRTAAEKALARAQERLRTVVGHAPIVLFGFDREGRLTLGEGRGLAAAGLRMDELAGRSVFEVYRDAPSMVEHARRALAGEAFTATVELDRRAGAGARVYETRYNPIFDEQGRVAEVVGVATDITERANAERALRRSEAQLLEADRLASLGALAAGVAHEINNPLAYVLLNLDLVIRTLEEQSAAATCGPLLGDLAARLCEARSGVERVRSIAHDLKAFSRIDHVAHPAGGPRAAGDGDHATSAAHRAGSPRAGDGDPATSVAHPAIDVRRVLDSSIDIAANEIRHRAHLVRAYGDVPLVEADPSRLGQVFLNLLVNAAQAMEVGGAAAQEIRVATGVTPAGQVEVTITDTGSGIPAALIDRIFEPFFTTKPAGVGTGLGLSICKGIVASLGGDIQVHSVPGEGTTFRVLLPPAPMEAREPDPPPPPVAPCSATIPATLRNGRASSQPPAHEPAPSDEAAPAVGADGKVRVSKRARVLVVDDEPVLASALARSLQPEYEVKVLSDGREALDLLRDDDDFDAILCDLIMPAVTGMDLHEELVRVRPDLARRIIFMTGGTFTPRTREFLAGVENPTLDKPFDLGALDALLRARARLR